MIDSRVHPSLVCSAAFTSHITELPYIILVCHMHGSVCGQLGGSCINAGLRCCSCQHKHKQNAQATTLHAV